MLYNTKYLYFTNGHCLRNHVLENQSIDAVTQSVALDAFCIWFNFDDFDFKSR